MMKVLQIDPRDNLLVALTDLKAGDSVEHAGRSYTLTEDINAKHKFAMRDFAEGELIYLYGVLVGKTTQPVAKGALLHTHNLLHAAEDFGLDHYQANSFEWTTKPDISQFEGRTFDGFPREDGRVGTANYWVVIPMVFCENRNLKIMEEAFAKSLGYAQPSQYNDFAQRLTDAHKGGDSLDEVTFLPTDTNKEDRLFQNVDGVKFLRHSMGCGSDRRDSDSLCALLAGYAAHPNVAGVTVLSLGCQHAQISIMQDFIKKNCPEFNRPFLTFEQQQYPSEQKLLEDAIRATFKGLTEANKLTRQPAPLSKLIVGMECGASDGFSGISANPAIGHVTDVLAALGGSPILSEFPELCGVEADLIRRCDTKPLAERFIQIMRAYNAAANAVGSDFSTNPSPGNIKDGLITDAIKSAGAAKKGGTAPVADVKDYTEQVTAPGLTLLCTPGNDVESTTAMAGSGANVMLFSTGLGTPTGNPVSPVIKVATNSTIAENLSDIIDFDAGCVIKGEKTIAEAGNDLLELIIETASGRYTTKSVALGQDDFIPWRRGVSL